MSGRPSAGNSTSTTVPITWTTLPLVPLGIVDLLIPFGRPLNASGDSLPRLTARALRRRGRIYPPRRGVSGGHPYTPGLQRYHHRRTIRINLRDTRGDLRSHFVASASTPPVMSRSSLVMLSWRALL